MPIGGARSTLLSSNFALPAMTVHAPVQEDNDLEAFIDGMFVNSIY